jgi:ATP-binding cassette subfamily C protein LapB
MKSDGLTPLVQQAAQLAGQALHRARIDAMAAAVVDIAEKAPALDFIRAAWRAAGLEGDPQDLKPVTLPDLPVIGWDAKHGWLIVRSQNADASWTAATVGGGSVQLDDLDRVECVSIPRRALHTAPTQSAARMVSAAVWQRRLIFFEAMIATVLINLLVLAVSLYTMQVYNRVIPNQGFDTLWVLSVGVVVSIGLGFMLTQVRTVAIDRTCNAIDKDLSEWFFARALGIRMDARPQSVGTLAAQIKGFEQVRGIMTATPIFILVDVPFGLLFTALIFVIAGPLAIVPLIAMPLCLAAGLIFQGLIARGAREHQTHNHRKTGLLVESIDGAESLKANSADWKIQARWNEVVEMVAESDYRVRRFSSLSQQLAMNLQQICYVGMIAYGAYLVADNQLTLGALIGCAIIANRALAPIIQLPGVMVQWAHARAALTGLDKIIALPNETDEAGPSLVPTSSSGELGFDAARFSYSAEGPPALGIAKLGIRPGEKTGIIGAVGSGKSTLLKLASGLYRPTQGKVYLDSIDMAMIAPAFLRETIAYLPQEPRLFSGTLRDNLLLGLPDPGDEAILQVARKTGLIDLITTHPKGLGLPITEGGRGISGGQRQLVALSRVLLAAPKVWVLDEPTAAMDAATEARIVQLLREAASSGATLLVATHKNALLPLFDRIIVLQGGRVAFDGPREQVLEKLGGRPAGRDSVALAGSTK